jgi:poly-gamma-glutamate synthesis protein (capsule biosynthesis protein)
VGQLTVLGPNLHPLHPGLDGPSETWWSSAIIEVALEEGRPAGLRLTPVELGRNVGPDATLRRPVGKERYTDGRPLIAEGENAKAVLDRFSRLSKPLGTELKIEGNTAWIACI